MTQNKDLIAGLKLAKSYIDTPEKWIKRELAMDASGQSVLSIDSDACKFCAVGALFRAEYKLDMSLLDDMKNAIYDLGIPILNDNGIMRFNDDPLTTHTDVMQVFDYAINKLESEI